MLRSLFVCFQHSVFRMIENARLSANLVINRKAGLVSDIVIVTRAIKVVRLIKGWN